MRSHTSRNIPLPLTKTWNTYSPGRRGFLLDHKSIQREIGLPSAVRVLPYSNAVSDLEGTKAKRGRRRKKEMKSRGRSSPYMTKSAVIDRRRKLEEVDIDDEDRESMDEGTMSDI
jgi:hypothetical protein